MFQWTGGAMELSVGDVINRGTINLSGANETQIYADGTLDDFGSIIQTGTGNFGLHSDNITPTTLKIENGGQYLMESNAGINNVFSTNLIENAGTIAKKAGTGTSTIAVNGQLINTGTLEADSGTLDLEPSSFAQIDSSGKLTSGTWNALDGATIKFRSGTKVTANAANVRLDGSGAAMPALALASNSGTLALTNGATLSTPGDFANSGTLTVGDKLNIAGNFTQTSAGTLDEQIGGNPASGQFGQLVATGSATLSGNFDLTLVNSFTPVAEQDYPVLKYASASGSFATITGLVSGMTANQTATEFDLNMPVAGGDLALTSVTAPTTAVEGQSITVNWQVADQGSSDANGSWVDSVYLSTTPTITANSILLDNVTHTGGLTATSNYNASLTKTLPALAPGNYYVLVDADSHFQVADANRANNTLAATAGQLAVTLPSLTLGAPANGSFTAANQDQYYQVTVPAGGTLIVTLTSTATAGATALYVSQGATPTSYSYQFTATANQPNESLTVPNAAGGTYDILVHSIAGAAATASYTLTVSQTNALGVSATSLTSGGNAGKVTVEVDGTNFAPNVTASLTLGATTIAAAAIEFVSSSKFFATFDLSGAAVGSYTLNVVQGAQTVTAPNPFQIVSAAADALQLDLIVPAFVRSGRTAPIVVTYANTTGNDIAAPLLTVSSTNANVLFSSPANPSSFAATAQIVASVPNGPTGIIPPGQSGQLTFTLLSHDTVDHDPIWVQVSPTANNMVSLSPASQPLGSAFDGPPPSHPQSRQWGRSRDNGDVQNLTSFDPNDIVGPSGYGTPGFIQPTGVWPYTVDFENDGSVAAQDVTVTQQLNPNLDWSTFQLGSFGFGSMNVSVPAGLTQYQTTVSYHNVDGSALNVLVAFDFNVQTGLLTATFNSLDPASGLPPSGLTDGFLPPNNANGIGEGFVEYTVQPKSGLTTGSTVNAAASVVFDINAPISTATISNTIDAGAPTSSVAVLPATETSTSFTVSWSGSDDTGGSGIANYSVFVSDNGGSFTAFQTNTTATSATFTGVSGHTYAFYSLATDNVGNAQPAPTAAQTATTVSTTPFLVTDRTYVIGTGTITVSATNGVLSGDTGPTQLSVTAGAATGAEGGTFTINADGSFTYAPPSNFPGYDSTQVTVTDISGDKGTETVTVLSQHAGVVWKFYESVLNRTPDPGGLQYWTNYFDNGGSTGDMAFGFFESDELLNKVLGNYYQQYLLRPLDADGLAYWKGVWHATGGPEQIKAGFADSPEFYKSSGGTPDSWIDALYQRILNRTPDPGGKSFWLNYYQQQTAAGVDAGVVRYQIALGFFTAIEAYGNDVTGWFQEYLFRVPTDAEKAQYVNQMLAGASDRTIEQAITNLPEYASNPPAPAASAAAALGSFYQTPQSQAAIAAKDALFSSL